MSRSSAAGTRDLLRRSRLPLPDTKSPYSKRRARWVEGRDGSMRMAPRSTTVRISCSARTAKRWRYCARYMGPARRPNFSIGGVSCSNSPVCFACARPRLPAPWHLAAALLTMRGVSWRDRLRTAAVRPKPRTQSVRVFATAHGQGVARRSAGSGHRLALGTAVHHCTQHADRYCLCAGFPQRHATRVCDPCAGLGPAVAACRPVDAVSRCRSSVRHRSWRRNSRRHDCGQHCHDERRCRRDRGLHRLALLGGRRRRGSAPA